VRRSTLELGHAGMAGFRLRRLLPAVSVCTVLELRLEDRQPGSQSGGHSHCSRPDCSAAQGGLCREAPARPVAQPNRSPATGLIDTYPGGTFIRQRNAPFRAHTATHCSAPRRRVLLVAGGCGRRTSSARRRRAGIGARSDQLDPRPTKGFTTARSAKRLKSRSADQSSRTPCCLHRAAMRAS
jgi:hypothetical protein